MEHKTENMSISLPREMKAHIKQWVKEGHFGTPSDYMRSLVREDLRRRDQERLENTLLQGLQSGRGTEIKSKRDWKKFWYNIDARAGERRVKKYA